MPALMPAIVTAYMPAFMHAIVTAYLPAFIPAIVTAYINIRKKSEWPYVSCIRTTGYINVYLPTGGRQLANRNYFNIYTRRCQIRNNSLKEYA